MFAQKSLNIFAALAHTLSSVGVPGATLIDDVKSCGHVQNVPFPGDPLAVHNIELSHLEGRSQLVFYRFDPRSATNTLLAVLNGAYPPNVQPYRGIELEGITTGGGFWIAEQNSNFHADLIDENHRGPGFADGCGQF